MRDFFLPLPSAFIAPVPAPSGGEVLYPDPTWDLIGKMALLHIALLIPVFYLAGSIFGHLRTRSILGVGVTRKLFCMTMFSLGFIYPRIASFQAGLVSTAITILLILSLSDPIRNSFLPSRLTFMAVSRDGEHDKTVLWLWTESFVTSLIIFFGAAFVQESGREFYPWFLLYPALVSGLADSAAEILGSTWGKRTYKTTAMFDDRAFERTVEGSLAFFAVTSAISIVMGLFLSPDGRALSALIFLPVILTLTEAKSPHSWDNPFLFLMSYLTVFAVYSV